MKNTMAKNIFVIGQNTFKELLRNRILYAFVVFAFFLIALMFALGQLSFTEQYRLTLSLGLAAIHMSLVGMTLFVGGSVVYREIERLTILTVLAKPIRRSEFLLGKYFGFLQLMVLFVVGFYTLYVLNMKLMGFEFNSVDVAVPFAGFILEILVLLAVTIFFSTFCSSFLTIMFSLSLFIVGHWMGNLSSLVKNSQTETYIWWAEFFKKVLPNLENFNWRAYPLEYNMSMNDGVMMALVAALWIVFFLAAATLIFGRRDFA